MIYVYVCMWVGGCACVCGYVGGCLGLGVRIRDRNDLKRGTVVVHKVVVRVRESVRICSLHLCRRKSIFNEDKVQDY